jgi:hypothetical protein
LIPPLFDLLAEDYGDATLDVSGVPHVRVLCVGCVGRTSRDLRRLLADDDAVEIIYLGIDHGS